MRTPNKPLIEEGIRTKLAQLLVTRPKLYILLQSLGIGRRRIKRLATQPIVPSLREALAIDCATNGECNVYSWVDTEWMEQRSNRDTEQEANNLWKLWPRPILQEHRNLLRLHMVQRLGAPDRNVLAIVAKLGYAEISKQARKELTYKLLQLPVCVEDDCDDECLQKQIDRRERRRAKANAFIKGKRSGP